MFKFHSGKVYLLFTRFVIAGDDLGIVLEGVFSSEEKAKEYISRKFPEAEYNDRKEQCEHYVDEWEQLYVFIKEEKVK